MTNEETPSRKKYLVPLVVVLLCGVAMTGAAYAYSAELKGGSDVDTDYYTLQFNNASNKLSVELKDFKLKFDSVSDTEQETNSVTCKLASNEADRSVTITIKGVDKNNQPKAFDVKGDIIAKVYAKNATTESAKLKATAIVKSGDEHKDTQQIVITFTAINTDGDAPTFTEEEVKAGFKLVLDINSDNYVASTA